LYDLTPVEFHGLFAPLLAAFGDAETMEGWLASTEFLADVDLRGSLSPRPTTKRPVNVSLSLGPAPPLTPISDIPEWRPRSSIEEEQEEGIIDQMEQQPIPLNSMDENSPVGDTGGHSIDDVGLT
jgi:hypothetical protein